MRSTTWGSHSLPPLAIAAYIVTICSSVTRVEPCPMTAFSDCPIWKPSALGFSFFWSRYQASVGMKPPSSPFSPNPVGAPSPMSAPYFASRSIMPGRAPMS